MEEKEKTDRDQLKNLISHKRAAGKQPKPKPVKVEYEHLKRPIIHPTKYGEKTPKLTR